MRTIYKYDLNSGEQELPLPLNSRLLSVACQHGSQIVAYAEVDPEQQATEVHTLHVCPTGGPLTHNGGAAKFLGTVELPVYGYWFHVYHTAPKGAAVTSATA